MSLHVQYDSLFMQYLPEIANGRHQIDHYLDNPADNRYGLSLILQVGTEVNQEVQQFLSEVKKVAPDQYYYTPAQTHITVLSIISCSEGFQLDSVKVPDYIQVVLESLEDIKAFVLNYRGITASNSGLLLQGFPETSELDKIRNNLRTIFRASGLKESMDQRYRLSTAHATLMRFKTQLRDPDRFVNILTQNRDRYFGTESISRLHLVYNDWYHRPERTQVLRSFLL